MSKQKKRVVITGVGVVSPIGIGTPDFWQGLEEGRCGVKPVTLFDTAEMKTKLAGEVSDFDAEKFLGKKGLRLLDRSTKLVAVASKLALDDAGFKVTAENTGRAGIVLGTTMGSIRSISDFDLQALREGWRSVNPALFPNTVINSPASQAAIRFGVQGFNATVSTGFTAAPDALKYAWDFIDMGRAEAVLVGGVEELCLQTYLGFYKLDFLAGIKEGGVELCCPFDNRRNGIVFGEGAVMLLLEDLSSARQRGAKIYAEVKSQGYAFVPYRVNKYHRLGTGLRAAMRRALGEAELEPGGIDYISANANSTREADLIESEAIKDVFGVCAGRTPVSSIKSMIGESFSCCGAMQLAAGVGSLERQFVPPTINYQAKDARCDLDYVPNQARKKEVKNILINCFGPSNVYNCVVLSKYSAEEN